MTKRTLLSFFFVCCWVSFISATEATFFENLGFSADGRYFLFGQYGSDSVSKKPFAEIYFVNVDRNTYYPGGTFAKSYPKPLEVGEDGKSALFALLAESAVVSLRERLKISHLAVGRLIYQVYDAEGEAKDFSRKDITFEDFGKGEGYRVTLRQSVDPVKNGVESSFFINAQILGEKGEVFKNITVGHPKHNRSNITNYRVAQVYLTPEERDLLFVVERENTRPDGTIFYDYMIEIGKIK
jgi:predicted secreted protein